MEKRVYAGCVAGLGLLVAHCWPKEVKVTLYGTRENGFHDSILCTNKGEFVVKNFQYYNRDTKKLQMMEKNQEFKLYYHGFWAHYVDDIFYRKPK
jgi:hypothetical protein